MYQKPTVPRTIGGVLDDTFQLYKAAFSSCWLPMVVIAVIGMASAYYRFSNVPAVTPGTGFRQLLLQFQAVPPGYQALNLLVLLLDLLLYAVLVLNIVGVSRGGKPTFGTSLATALRRFPALILATIIFAVAVFVGTVLVIIPGIYLGIRLGLFMVPLLTGPEGPGTSLTTSWRLVAGHWWRTFTLVCVMLVILYVVDLALVAIAGSIAAVVRGGAVTIVQSVGSFVVGSIVISAIVGIFTTPVFITVFVTVYQDLLLRKEGGDLEARLGALAKG